MRVADVSVAHRRGLVKAHSHIQLKRHYKAFQIHLPHRRQALGRPFGLVGQFTGTPNNGLLYRHNCSAPETTHFIQITFSPIRTWRAFFRTYGSKIMSCRRIFPHPLIIDSSNTAMGTALLVVDKAWRSTASDVLLDIYVHTASEYLCVQRPFTRFHSNAYMLLTAIKRSLPTVLRCCTLVFQLLSYSFA